MPEVKKPGDLIVEGISGLVVGSWKILKSTAVVVRDAVKDLADKAGGDDHFNTPKMA